MITDDREGGDGKEDILCSEEEDLGNRREGRNWGRDVIKLRKEERDGGVK